MEFSQGVDQKQSKAGIEFSQGVTKEKQKKSALPSKPTALPEASILGLSAGKLADLMLCTTRANGCISKVPLAATTAAGAAAPAAKDCSWTVLKRSGGHVLIALETKGKLGPVEVNEDGIGRRTACRRSLKQWRFGALLATSLKSP